MNAISRAAGRMGNFRWSHGIALVAMVWGNSAMAQIVAVPAAHLNFAEGTVALSPQGDTEWHDVQPLRVLKRGDRLWTDRGSRAEVQAGGLAVRLDGQTQLVLENVTENATQLSVTQGSIVLTVPRLNPGDTIEIGTPNLAFRARQAGDYRIDVDPKAGTTRVAVTSGTGVVFGEKGEALELRNGQRAAFRSRDLSRLPLPAFAAMDAFDRWASARQRGEPTVTMPSIARAAPAAPPQTELVNRGRDIIISGPASSLPGSKLGPGAAKPLPTAAAAPQLQIKGPPVAAVAPSTAGIKAQPIPNVAIGPAVPAAAPLRVNAPSAPAAPAMATAVAPSRTQAQADADARAQAQVEAGLRAQAQAQAQAQARAAREQQERDRLAAQQKQDEDRRAAAARKADDDRKAVAARRVEESRRAAARRDDEQRKAADARRVDDAKREARARAEQDHKRQLAKKADEKRLAAQRREQEIHLAAERAREALRISEARRRQLARLQEQAGREVQSARDAQVRRDVEARQRADDDGLAQVRREEADRRQRQLADQWRRDQAVRDQEGVWLRQQQVPVQPMRPSPMGIPARPVS